MDKKKSIISGIGGVIIVLCVCGTLVYFHYDHIQKNRVLRANCFRSALILLANESLIQGNDSWITALGHAGQWRLRENSWRFNSSSDLASGANAEYIAREVCDLSKPWNVSPNITLRNTTFCWTGTQGCEDYYWTNIMALAGEDTAMSAREPKPSGCEDLIVLVEVANSGIHWAEPGDINIDHLPENFTSGTTGDGIMVMFLDGTVWFIHQNIPVGVLKKFFTVEGARQYDRMKELLPYADIYMAPASF